MVLSSETLSQTLNLADFSTYWPQHVDIASVVNRGQDKGDFGG